MSELLPEDLYRAVRFIPKDLRALIVKYRLMVAGGFPRAIVARETVNDIDLFGPSADSLNSAADYLALTWGVKATRTRNAITVAAPGRKPVQFISRWLFTHPESVIKSFDFTIAQAIIYPGIEGDSVEWRSLISDRFYADLAAKRLVYTEPERNEDAGGSLMRVLKFAARDYIISPASYGRVLARLAERVKWDHPLAADEAGKAKILTGLLRQVDPLLAIDGVEAADEEIVLIPEIANALHAARFSEDAPIPDSEE